MSQQAEQAQKGSTGASGRRCHPAALRVPGVPQETRGATGTAGKAAVLGRTAGMQVRVTSSSARAEKQHWGLHTAAKREQRRHLPAAAVKGQGTPGSAGAAREGCRAGQAMQSHVKPAEQRREGDAKPLIGKQGICPCHADFGLEAM